MDPITETPVTDTPDATVDPSAEVALSENSANDSFGREVTKTLLVSIATTAIMTGGAFAASYANAKFQQFRIERNLRKVEKAKEILDAKVIEMKTQEDQTEKD